MDNPNFLSNNHSALLLSEAVQEELAEHVQALQNQGNAQRLHEASEVINTQLAHPNCIKTILSNIHQVLRSGQHCTISAVSPNETLFSLANELEILVSRDTVRINDMNSTTIYRLRRPKHIRALQANAYTLNLKILEHRIQQPPPAIPDIEHPPVVTQSSDQEEALDELTKQFSDMSL